MNKLEPPIRPIINYSFKVPQLHEPKPPIYKHLRSPKLVREASNPITACAQASI